MKEEYKNWLEVKADMSDKIGPVFSERDIWWCSLGKNLGEEIDGKNQTFERPVLIYKKTSKNSFLGLPITSKEKQGSYFYQYTYDNRKVSVMLHQVRYLSNKRLLRRLGKMSHKKFSEIEEKYSSFIKGKDLISKPRAGLGVSRTPSGEDK